MNKEDLDREFEALFPKLRLNQMQKNLLDGKNSPCSPKQRGYIYALMDKVGVDNFSIQEITGVYVPISDLTKGEASIIIDTLREMQQSSFNNRGNQLW